MKVSYTDLQGTPEVVYSQSVNGIQAVDDNPTGALIITGSRLEGKTLVADTSGIMDNDGVGEFSYQWQRSDTGSSNWGNISSAQAKSYTLVNDDASKYVRAIVAMLAHDHAGIPASKQGKIHWVFRERHPLFPHM